MQDLSRDFTSLQRASAIVGDHRFPVLGRCTEELFSTVRAFSNLDETILLSGPSGAGKSRLAEFCHAESPRAQGPFQLVDLLSIPEDMQMAELFGWRRGAFTGAVRDHDGFVARSHGGTLFIDEIDKLSLRTQAGLLQFMESRAFRPLGDTAGAKTADVRLIVATNVNLRERVRSGGFREDLYFRISVLPIRVPSLGERRDEVVPWARFMLTRCHRRARSAPMTLVERADQAPRFERAAEVLLADSDWPGNLRQLDNVVRRAYALTRADDPGAEPVVVGARQIERAFSCDQPEACVLPALASLRQAADALFVQLSRAAPGLLRLEDVRAFEGLVLQAGLERVGDLAEVYRRLGAEALVDGRNHHRHFRRELERVTQLERALEAADSSKRRQSAITELAGGARSDEEVERDVGRPRFEIGHV